jgi:hypothetical protein
MDIPNHAELLARIELFCLRHDMAETRFGREAVSNPNFISGLRRDPPVSPTLKTLNEVQDFMARIDAEAALRAKLARAAEPSETPPPTKRRPSSLLEGPREPHGGFLADLFADERAPAAVRGERFLPPVRSR